MIGSLSTCLIALSLLGVVLPGSEEKGEIGSDRGERVRQKGKVCVWTRLFNFSFLTILM